VNALKPLLQPHTTLLVKGSRFMAMERIVNALRDHPNQSVSAPSSETH
jgi:UDP-N-acetylmuramyl pentapeptide synthase